MTSDEIKSISMLINEARESAQMQRDLITDDLKDGGYNVPVLEELVRSSSLKPDKELTDEEVNEIFNKIIAEGGANVTTNREFVEYGIKSINDIIDTEKDLDELEKEANGEIKSYTDYICSEEYDKHRMKNIDMWKDMLKRETNFTTRKKLQKAIYITEERYTLGFMFERLNNPETHDDEKKRMAESFFANSKSAYVLEKFGAKCKQFGFSEDLYRYLLDLEQKYLEEKYHVFNNFFLFTALRFIGHCGTEEVNEAKEIIQCMLNLIYNRFYSDEVKDTFLNTIRTFLDNFEDVRDEFDEKNILHPNHPYRIQKEKEREADLRVRLYHEIAKHVEIDDAEKEKLDAMNITELLQYHNSLIEKTEEPTDVAPVDEDTDDESDMSDAEGEDQSNPDVETSEDIDESVEAADDAE